MDQFSNIVREGAIVLGLVALVFGVGFGLLRLRRSMGGGIDDRLKLSTSQTLAKAMKVFLAITAVLWIAIWLLMRDEYGGNLGAALDGLMQSVVPSEPSAPVEGEAGGNAAPGTPAPPTR